MNGWADVLVDDVEVWAGVLFGVLALAIHLHQLRAARGRNRALSVIILAAVAWLTAGYAVLGLNILGDESRFGALWLRPAGVTMLAIVAALGIGERRNL